MVKLTGNLPNQIGRDVRGHFDGYGGVKDGGNGRRIDIEVVNKVLF